MRQSDFDIKDSLGGVSDDAVKRLADAFHSEMERMVKQVTLETRANNQHASVMAVAKVDLLGDIERRLYRELERRADERTE